MISVNYPLHDLDDTRFEKLVVTVCDHILGPGTIPFAEGMDGGRDAKFTGTANMIPSETDPWSGKFIIQAKHTSSPVASYSDKSFMRIFEHEELPRIAALKNAGKIDYYLLFSNRKLTGIQDPKIEGLIEEKVGVKNLVFGIERINLWLNEFLEIPRISNLNSLLMPLQFYEHDLQELIIVFSKTKIQKRDIKEIEDEISRISIDEKNRLNNLSEEYFNNQLKMSVDAFAQIGGFLRDPKNTKFLEMYENTVSDIQEEILIHRAEYHTFDQILNHLFKLVFDSVNIELKNKRKLIRVFLHYMYFHCDIGVKEEQNA